MVRRINDSDAVDEFERQMDRIIHQYFPDEHRARPRLWHPPTDVYETDAGIIVKIEVAGMAPDDFTISFINRTLIIRGVRQDTEEKLSFHRLEIPYGEFQIEVFLADTFDANRIDARYEQGFLCVTLPKSKSEHRVPVRVASKES